MGHMTVLKVALAVGVMAVASGCGNSKSAAGAPVEFAKLDTTLKDVSGQDVRLADLKGRPLVINFWATYCGPCKEEIPMLIELAAKYQSRGVTVLGISADDTPADLKPFVAEHKMTYPVLVGAGHDEFLEAYDAQVSIPRTWFVRADGSVAAKSIGPNTREWFEKQFEMLVSARGNE